MGIPTGTPAATWTPPATYKLGYRYYDPTQGRFTQQDPAGLEANAYLYAGGDPMTNVDPNGLYCLTGTVDGPGTACRGIGDTASAIGKDALQGGKEGFGDGAAIGAGLGCTNGFVGSIGSRTRAADQCAQDGKFLGFAGSIIGGGVGTVGGAAFGDRQ